MKGDCIFIGRSEGLNDRKRLEDIHVDWVIADNFSQADDLPKFQENDSPKKICSGGVFLNDLYISNN